jgi:hypothetical protein
MIFVQHLMKDGQAMTVLTLETIKDKYEGLTPDVNISRVVSSKGNRLSSPSLFIGLTGEIQGGSGIGCAAGLIYVDVGTVGLIQPLQWDCLQSS